MENLRIYGDSPFRAAVIHGGPGSPGNMAPVAQELSRDFGIIEPLQTAASLEGQVQELRGVVEKNAVLPLTLIGSSWGAMLSYIFSAYYPALVRKCILVGSGVYDDVYASRIQETRLSRLSEGDRQEALALLSTIDDPDHTEKDKSFYRLGMLFSVADAYDPLPYDDEVIEAQFHIFQRVWGDAAQLRSSGKLLELGRQIQCPVVAIHGDYDPHPAEGIQRPLSTVLKSFKFVLLKNCGHLPWIERSARDQFFRILKEALK
ncbi:alpha/beta fold hydrolase [Chloroflexota bacterium]